MRIGRGVCWGALVGGAGVVLALGQNAEAHEKWFLDPEPYPLRVEKALADPLTWLAIVAPIILWVVAMLLWRWRGQRSIIPGPKALGGRPEAKGSPCDITNSRPEPHH